MNKTLVCGLLALFACAAANANVSQEIEKLLKANNTKAAYALAQQHVWDLEGNPDFDLQYGLAALASGEPDKAIFPLERLVIQFPNHHRARLELARAFYLVGDYDSSRTQFAKVKSINPPENVVANIDRFLSAMQTNVQQSNSTVYKAHVAAGAGYDFNVNSATTSDSVSTILGEIVLSESSKARKDRFVEYELGANLITPITRNQAFYAEIGATHRVHGRQRAFDLGTISAKAAYQYAWGKTLFRLPISAQQAFLDQDSYRDTISTGLDISRQLTANDQVSLNLRYGRFYYDKSPVQDTVFFMSTLSAAHSFSPVPVILNAAVSYVDEGAKGGAEYNGKTGLTAYIGAQWFVTAKHVLYASVNRGYSAYKQLHPVFGIDREGNSVGSSAGWRWEIDKNFSLNTSYQYQRNDSNISVYDYDRHLVQSKLRYDFF